MSVVTTDSKSDPGPTSTTPVGGRSAGPGRRCRSVPEGGRAAVFELKLLSKEGIPGALAKAERYRLLNQPWEAECIYRDVLQVDPRDQEATVGLVLAITDQFGQGLRGSVNRAREVLPRLS